VYYSPNIITVITSRRMGYTGNVARMGGMKYGYRILIDKSEWKRPIGRPRRRWEDNITMDIRQIGWKVVNWIHLGQDRD
jgi:hypothetical protein